MTKHIIFSTVLIILSVTSIKVQAQIQEISILASKIHQYEKAEWDVTLLAEWANPYDFSDIALDMELTSPYGYKIVLPCFYFSGESNNESNWKARFTPQEAGAYQYRFKLTDNGKVMDTSDASEFSSFTSNKKGFLHANNNWSFKFDNSKVFRGIGENIGWESRSNDDSRFFKKIA